MYYVLCYPKFNFKSGVLFSTGWTMNIPHTGWGLGPSMQGVMVKGLKGFQFSVLPSTWPDLPAHPPILEGTKEVLIVLYKVIHFFLLQT